MDKVTEKNFVESLLKRFPEFQAYWDNFLNDYGSIDDEGIFTEVMPFADFVIDVIKSKDEKKIKDVFDFIELLVCKGDDSVQTVMTTGLLEYLMNKDPDEIQFSFFVEFMGKESVEYCKAWDKFCGTKTEGLWDKDE